MGIFTIDNKKFVVIEQEKFDKFQLLPAAQKSSPVKKNTLTAGKKHAYKLIDTWAKVK